MLIQRLLAGIATATFLVAIPALPAAAAPPCDEFGNCKIEVGTPGRPGGAQPIDNPGPGGGSDEGGGGQSGYIRPPQPPPMSDPYGWTGATEWWWGCGQWNQPGASCVAPPPGVAVPGGAAPAPPPVDPAVLAQQAVAALQVSAPQIGIVPEMRPGRLGVVGAPVWMWTPPEQWRTLTATVTADGLSVTAVATLTNITWDMGDGTVVTCQGPGTPYERRYGVRMSPDCGHRYEQTSVDQPGQEYVVEATANWDVTWSGATSGAQDVPLSSTTALQIGEIQVIVTG